ncbi:hypothetical protein Clacol_009475 [Clathrus columnatus]|uniref:DUF6699 domain-containing protein n=1 Tax=Clathrus columnatus TaxID=1419009 RepID=A0AAV5APV8_9AGAM|nr:hypothetical protein Clacol_009475 [Clathrus columnatus]
MTKSNAFPKPVLVKRAANGTYKCQCSFHGTVLSTGGFVLPPTFSYLVEPAMTQISSDSSEVDDKSVHDGDTYTESVAASSYAADTPGKTIPAPAPRIASLSPGTDVSPAGPTPVLPPSRGSQGYYPRRWGPPPVASNRLSYPKKPNNFELDDSFVNDFSQWLAPESWSANPEHDTIEQLGYSPSTIRPQPSNPRLLNNPTRFQELWKTENRKSFSNWCDEETDIVPPRPRPVITRPPTSPSPPPPELPPKKETDRNRNRTEDTKPYLDNRDWDVPGKDYDLDSSKYSNGLGGWEVPVPRYNKNIVPPRRRPVVIRPPASPSPPPPALPPKKETHRNRTEDFKPYAGIEGYTDERSWDFWSKSPGKYYDLDDSKYTDGGWGRGWGSRKGRDLVYDTTKGWGLPPRDPSPGKKTLRFEEESVGDNYDDALPNRETQKWRKATVRRSPSRSPSPSGHSPVRENKTWSKKPDTFFIPPIFGNSKGYYLQFHELLRPGPKKIDWNVTQSPYEFAYYPNGSHAKRLPIYMESFPATEPPIKGMCLIMDEVTRFVCVKTSGGPSAFVTIGMVMWHIYDQLTLAPIAAEDWFDLADGRDYPHRMKVIASKKRAERRDNPRAPALKWGDMLEKKVYFGGIVDFVEKPVHGGNLPTFIVNFEE